MSKKVIYSKWPQKVFAIALALLMVIGTIVPASTTNSSAFSGKKGSTYTTHSSGRVEYGPGEGGYSNTLKTDLDDSLGSRYSYCVQPNRASVPAGTATVDKVIDDDDDKGKWNAMRNIMYYSPSYPGYDKNIKNAKEKYYTGTFDTDWGIAHLALSYVYAGRPDDLDTWAGTKASNLGSVWTKAKALGNAMYGDGTYLDDAVPEGFKVFICFQSGIQDMMVGYLNTGYLTLEKSSSNPSLSNGKNCYSLAGAEYEVENSEGNVVATLVTDESGKTKKVELPTGHYTITEKTAAKGFAIDTKSHNVTVIADETVKAEVKDTPQNDPFGIILNKVDKETGKASALAGASLEGAIFEISYYDAIYTSLDQVNQKDYRKTWKLKTDEDGIIIIPKNDEEMKTYFVSGPAFDKSETNRNTFAIGSYTVKEISAPEGYEIDSTTHLAVVPEKKNSTTEVINTYNMLTSKGEKIYEPVNRGDLEFVKKDASEERLANCAFKVTSESTGESHIIVTDPNGRFTSTGTVNPATANKNDEALKSDGTLDESKLNYKNKVWFGMDKEGNTAEPNAQLRPFAYDTYVIKELACEANKGKSLISTKAVVYEDGYVCDLGTITDSDIGTTFKDKDGNKQIVTSEKTTLVDTVRYDKLKKGQKYVLECTLMVKDTKEPLVENGEPITGTAEFTARSMSGTQDVEITFDTTGLEGKEIVAFEELYKLNEDGSKGDLIATHKDIEDEGQTVKFIKVQYNMYKIRTTDAPEALDPAGKYGFAKGETVDYDVVIENTGDLDLTMNVSDNFENEGYFSTPELKEVKNATWNNEGKDKYIANITVKAGETAIVTYTTTVVDAPVWLADTAKDSDSKRAAKAEKIVEETPDEIAVHMAAASDETADVNTDNNTDENNNVEDNNDAEIPEDEGVDCNMKDQTNEPVDDGWTNTARTTDVTYTVDDEDKKLDDKEDIAQTPIRPVPAIGTYLTADAKKETVASKTTKFVDTVSYAGLTAGNTYIMECTLMVKDTKDPMVENGEPITASTTFVPDKETGTTTVEFTIDTTGMEGKEIVAFESCYNTIPGNDPEKVEKNRTIAEHNDIDDKAQTVLIKKAPKKPVKPETKTPGPKTGDSSNLLIFGVILVIALAAGGFVVCRRRFSGAKK